MSLLPQMETHRLILRELLEEDLAAIHSYLSDPEVLMYMQHRPLNLEETRAYLQRFLQIKEQVPRGCYKFLIVLKENDDIIGECSIFIRNPDEKAGEILYRLNKLYWGKGYATEAAKELIRFGFRTLKLHRVEGTCDKRNIQSAKILEKIGMTFEGCLREHKLVNREWRSSLVYSILEGEFTE